MVFDADKFVNTKWEPRTAEIEVPALKDFFDEDQEPVWKVRGLTGVELGRANEAADRNRDVALIVQKLMSKARSENVDGVMEALGANDGKVPQEVAKRIEMFLIGTVEPKASLELAKTFLKAFPVEFSEITTQIIILTGAGHLPGK